MNCLEFRRLKLADPSVETPELGAHASTCSACRRFEIELRSMDEDIHKVAEIDVPQGMAGRILLNQSLKVRARTVTRRWVWAGLAASVMVAGFIGMAALIPSSETAFGGELISHVEMPHSSPDVNQLASTHLQRVLHSVDAESADLPGEVIYATNCLIDGEMVAHLMVRQGNDEFVVILVRHEYVTTRALFQQDGWRGVIEPHEVGNLAVMRREGFRHDAATISVMDMAHQYAGAFRRRLI